MDKRLVRFSSIAGIERRDLPIAVEIWLDDLTSASWSLRETVKLATHFARYIQQPDQTRLTIRAIEKSCYLERNRILDACNLMVMYGALDSYRFDGQRLKASLRLSYLQRLRVLEVRQLFSQLQSQNCSRELPWHAAEMEWMRACNVAADGRPLDDLLKRFSGHEPIAHRQAPPLND